MNGLIWEVKLHYNMLNPTLSLKVKRGFLLIFYKFIRMSALPFKHGPMGDNQFPGHYSGMWTSVKK